MKTIKANKLLVKKDDETYYHNWEIIDSRWTFDDKLIRWDGFYISDYNDEFYEIIIQFLDKHRINYEIRQKSYTSELFILHNSLYEID